MKSLDAEWVGPTLEIVSDSSELVRLNRGMILPRKERELFLNNETENPNFRYERDQLASADVTARATDLVESIESSSAHALVIDLYKRKLARQCERYQLLAATLNGDDETFYDVSTSLYGTPNSVHFAYVAARVIELCQNFSDKHPSESKRLQKVLSKINVDDLDISADILPSPILTGKPLESQAEAIAIFSETLERFGLGEWQIVEREGLQPNFSVRPEQQQVVIPQEEGLLHRDGITDLKIRAIAEHEVGVHARRTSNGKEQALQLLGIGLDDYAAGEEGVASYVQQQIEGADEFYGFDRYLAASLAVGMDGVKRDFRAVFSLMVDYYTLVHERDTISKPAFKPAWDVCVRIFRGTTGSTPGAIYTKDIIYLEGNIGVWHLLSEKPHVFESLFIGKFSPLLTRHVKSLQTLEILNEW